jgi:hypothetical protein
VCLGRVCFVALGCIAVAVIALDPQVVVLVGGSDIGLILILRL